MNTSAQCERMTAVANAYEFALRTMIEDFEATDGDEIAGVAAGYALEFWAEWLPGDGLKVETDPGAVEDESTIDSICYTPGSPEASNAQ